MQVKALLEATNVKTLSAEAQQDLLANPANRLAAYLAAVFSEDSLSRAFEVRFTRCTSSLADFDICIACTSTEKERQRQ